jgi:hypothetical protein
LEIPTVIVEFVFKMLGIVISKSLPFFFGIKVAQSQKVGTYVITRVLGR